MYTFDLCLMNHVVDVEECYYTTHYVENAMHHYNTYVEYVHILQHHAYMKESVLEWKMKQNTIQQ